MQGYDVVAYFTEGEPTRGSEDHVHTWQDVRWLFSSDDNRETFAADPERYAPRYGGFCAGGVALGNRAPIDPEAFVIVDGKLYLNYDRRTADEFGANADDSIARAERQWQKIGFTD